MIKKVFILLFVLGLIGCEEDDFRNVKIRHLADAGASESCGTSNRQWEQGKDFSRPYSPDWKATCFYPIAESFKGRYVSPKFDPFEITVDYDNREDYYRLSPKEIGELAYWMTAYSYLMDLPCESNRTPYEWLSKGHFVVVNDREVFKQLFNETERDANNFAAFIHGNKENVCWESPEDIYWTSVVRGSYWGRTDVTTVVHEMTHILSISVNGHSDAKHEDPRLWIGAGGKDSLDALVIKTHDCTYFPANCSDDDFVDSMLDDNN